MRSPHRRWHVSIFAVLLAISISMAFIAGCSPNGTAPNREDALQNKLDWLTAFDPANNADKGPVNGNFSPVLVDTVLAGTFGSQGGVLALFHDRSRLQVTFPAGCLDVETLITIHVTEIASPFGPFWVLDCGPDGTVFVKPISVTVTPGSASALFYFNDSTGAWEVQQVVSAKTVNPHFFIYHFSKYGIS